MTARWDVIVRVLNGPTASREPVVLRGPVVIVGTEPGPGGLVLPAGRGIAPQHATLTAYDPTTVFVAPQGHNPIRIGPYADVAWSDIEPIGERTRLGRGNAIHLGPTGARGITLEFLGCRDLGLQSTARLASDAADAGRVAERPPDGYAARATRPTARELVTDWMDPATFQAVLALFAAGIGLALVALLLVRTQQSSELVPENAAYWDAESYVFSFADHSTGAAAAPGKPVETSGYESQENAAAEAAEWAKQLSDAKGFDRAIFDFVIAPNRWAATSVGAGPTQLPELFSDDPSQWDPRFFGRIEAIVRGWANASYLYARWEEVHEPFREVVRIARENQLPEALAGIPMTESCYRSTPISPCCAKGWWQWMPEGGPRFSAMPDFGPDYAVRDCSWKGAPGATPFTPTSKTPVPGCCNPRSPNAVYVSAGPSCKLSECAVDFRTDLEKSTRASMVALGEAFNDRELRASGAVVQVTIASHNAGYHDALLFESDPPNKPYNLLPAFRRWYREKGSVPTSHFYGDVMRCASRDTASGSCMKYMMYETQRYSVDVLAKFLLAVCYYGLNYREEPEFAPWAKYFEKDQYCTYMKVPSKESLRGGNSKPVCGQ